VLNITLIGEKEVFAKLDTMPEMVRRILSAKLMELGERLKTHIQMDKLSGQVLNVVTGALRRSITRGPVEEIGDALMVSVFSAGDVKYAGIHEFGGQTQPHDIYPKNAQALAFMMGGQQIFAKVVHHPGSKMPERSFMRSSLDDMAATIIDELHASIQEGLAGAA
jgi:phage gpG-like protein